MKTLGELMHTDVLTVAPGASVGEAAALLGRERVSSVLVLDGERLAGIFTERDVVRALAAYFDAAQHPVEEWMASDPITATPTTTENEAIELMQEHTIRHLPVVEGERVVGIVSMRDLTHQVPD
jgi:CBS domain-containing protein